MAAVISIADARPGASPGASPDDWQHFDLVLGLTQDLLPVVSNPKAAIAPNSAMQALGKTPSTYNGARRVVGFSQWTQHTTTPEEISKWAKEKDYGICIQTRRVRALDIDIPEPGHAQRVIDAIKSCVGTLPARLRANSGKCLVAFELVGALTKRKITTAHGIIELLATGQQFVAVGTHPSGARYEWADGLPDQVPALTLEEVDALWAALAAEFAVEESTTQPASVKTQKLTEAASTDPIARHLINRAMVKRRERDGRMHITCPFANEHTSDSGDTATTYWPAHTGGYARGHFHCLHAHCEARTDQEFKDAINYADDDDLIGEFEAIIDVAGAGHKSGSAENTGLVQPVAEPAKPPRFAVQPAHVFADGPPPTWLIKGLLPKADLAVLFGESGSGKSFLALDLAVDVALGTPWRGKRTKRGRVVYIAAEGVGGFRNRLKALAMQRGLALDEIPVGVIPDAPDMLARADALDVAKAIVAAGGADLVVVDTWARVTSGANENSGEDMGRALNHCKGIHTATGALVLLVHHSGKDASKGARGWSGLRAAADVELEVLRNDNARSVTVTKQKDAEDGAEFGFRLNTVVLGVDSDGEEITSCVVAYNDDGAVKRTPRGPKGNIERLIISQLEEQIGLSGESVDVNILIELVKNQIPVSEGVRDQRSRHILRALDSLRDCGRISVNGVEINLN